jgi:hypothetical protein
MTPARRNSRIFLSPQPCDRISAPLGARGKKQIEQNEAPAARLTPPTERAVDAVVADQ